jgi:hypothetical protein
MNSQNVFPVFDPEMLATLVACALQHVEDVESGVEDGTYSAAENEDLPRKRLAVDTFASMLAQEGAGVTAQRTLASVAGAALPGHVADQVAQAGELLIRAAASLGSLTASEQDLVSKSDGGLLSQGIATALGACKAISPAIAQSLQNHPPRGFIAP